MMEFLHTDCESLYAKLKHQEKELTLKRRWLMGLALSNSEQKQVDVAKFKDNKDLPESFLREDDVYYETVKAVVKEGFRTLNGRMKVRVEDQEYSIKWIFDFPNNLRKIFSMLDEMTNHGLQLLVDLLTGGGSVKFVERTRPKMKNIIKECLPEVLLKTIKEDSIEKTRLASQLCLILGNPQNFRTKFEPSPKFYVTAALEVLDGLEDMHFLALRAMHRKLQGGEGYIPQLQPKKSGWGRSILIDKVRKTCSEMLSELGEYDDHLQEPLAKAMAVATLSSKVLQGRPVLVEFWKFPSEIVALQNEIAKAICLLKEKVRFPELKNLQRFLDPNCKLSNRSLRTAVNNLLIEFLLNCSDMDTIPEFLLETLSAINRTFGVASYNLFSEEEMEEEVESVLCMSAQMKQILWDLLPENVYDEDFADAYMEELEDSDDDGDNYNDDNNVDTQETLLGKCNFLHLTDGYDCIETIGETTLDNFNDIHDMIKPEHATEMNLMASFPPASTSSCFQVDSFVENMEEGLLHEGGSVMESNPSEPRWRSKSSSYLHPDERSNANHVKGEENTDNTEKPAPLIYSNSKNIKVFKNRNRYLDVQEACDKTGLFAYQLVGCILEEFAQHEGLDIDMANASYLRGDTLIQKDTQAAKEEHITYKEAAHGGSVIVKVLERILPPFPESGKKKVKELVGVK